MNKETELDDIAKLDQAWEEIEKAISSLGALVRSEEHENALQRFEGYRKALSIIAENYINQIFYDRKRPECLPTFGLLFNYAGPNPDFTYRNVHLEPGSSYRVWGRRGDAEIIDIQQIAGWFGQKYNGERKPAVTLNHQLFDNEHIKIGEHGEFDFIMSQSPYEGQWWKLYEGVTTLSIREYFTDYATQGRLTEFHFDKLEHDDQETTNLNNDNAAERLRAFASALPDYSAFSTSMHKAADLLGDHKYKEFSFGAGGVTDHRYFQSRFNIRLDEALICTWQIPEDYLYWGIALYNHPYQVLNVGNRQSNLNHALASVGPDRMFYAVISHRDPGVANWLDVDGHEKGFILARIKGELPVEAPALKLVPADEVLKHLPQDVEIVTKGERAARLAIRRKHYQRRENR